MGRYMGSVHQTLVVSHPSPAPSFPPPLCVSLLKSVELIEIDSQTQTSLSPVYQDLASHRSLERASAGILENENDNVIVKGDMDGRGRLPSINTYWARRDSPPPTPLTRPKKQTWPQVSSARGGQPAEHKQGRAEGTPGQGGGRYGYPSSKAREMSPGYSPYPRPTYSNTRSR